MLVLDVAARASMTRRACEVADVVGWTLMGQGANCALYRWAARRGRVASFVLSLREPYIFVDGNPLQTLQPAEPLPYHLQICDFPKREEAENCNFFRSTQFRVEQVEAVRFELLKSTYRVDRQSRPPW